MNMRISEIPRFSVDEAVAIDRLLDDAQISHEQKAVNLTHMGRFGRGLRTEYVILVPESVFLLAVGEIKRYFGIFDDKPEPFVGNCPACNAVVQGKTKCPECDLVLCPDLVNDPHSGLATHPFYIFLKQQKLL